jgi:hypothetical protein
VASILNEFKINKFFNPNDTEDFLLATALTLGCKSTSSWSNLTVYKEEDGQKIENESVSTSKGARSAAPTFLQIGNRFIKILKSKRGQAYKKYPTPNAFQEGRGGFIKYFKQVYNITDKQDKKNMTHFSNLLSLFIVKLYCKYFFVYINLCNINFNKNMYTYVYICKILCEMKKFVSFLFQFSS